MSTLFRGTVIRWNAERGFGFIRPADGKTDLFGHISECAPDVEELKPGQAVEFEIAQSSKKPGTVQAVNIELV